MIMLPGSQPHSLDFILLGTATALEVHLSTIIGVCPLAMSAFVTRKGAAAAENDCQSG